MNNNTLPEDDAISNPVPAPPTSIPEVEFSAPPAAPVSPEPEAALFEQIDRKIQQLQADFQSKIQYDQSKERVIDALHRELQGYREDLAFKILRPLIVDIMQLYDDIDAVTTKAIGDVTADHVRAQSRDFLADIETIFERYGFELYASADGAFDRKLHRVMRTEATDDPALDLMIAQRIRPGLRYGDRIIRLESVVVYQFKASTPSEQSDEFSS